MNGKFTNCLSELPMPKIILRKEISVTLSRLQLEHEVKLLKQKFELTSDFTPKQ